jgi:hypothetical protein
MIHRFTLDGVERGRFDHGVQGLAAVQFPPVAYDPRARLNIESPAFDSGNPATWSYAPVVRRVFGMAVNRGRLYYAVASGLRIWSVALLPDGSFGGDARIELDVPRGDLPGTEISEILFDDNGEMLLAERGAPTGAYDYEALAEPAGNRVLRFRPKARAIRRAAICGFRCLGNMRSDCRRTSATAMAASPSATATILPEISFAPRAAACCGAPANSCAIRASPKWFVVCNPAVRSTSTGSRVIRSNCSVR